MKKIRQLLIIIFTAVAFISTVNAASGSINASTNTKVAAVGSTFTVTVKVSCSEALGSWQFGVSYDSSNISLVSGNTLVAEYGNGSTKSKTYTYKFKAIKAGSANIRISSPSMAGWNEMTIFTPSTSGTSVTVKTQADIQASYSKDNNLKNITVEGYEISPAFNKDTTEYTVEVPDTVTSIKVNAQVNDGTAKVSGTGEIDISEGTNKVELVVTAQNGSTKTYTLTIDVKDLNPIAVTVDGLEYTIVKKQELLTEPIGHTPATIKIGEIEVPAFKSELTGFTIVGLKDKDGKISLFIYDEETNKYTPYIELKGGSVTLSPKPLPETLEGFSKTTIDINDISCEVLVSEIDKNLYVIYALNIETGEENYFIYDKKTNGFVTYTKDYFNTLLQQNKEFKLYLIATGSIAGILLLISIMLGAKKSKFKKMLIKLSNKVEPKIETNDNEEEVEIEEIHTEKQNKRRKRKH